MRYVTDDGKAFTDHKSASKHEHYLKRISALHKRIASILQEAGIPLEDCEKIAHILKEPLEKHFGDE